jgi:hypothetical protein
VDKPESSDANNWRKDQDNPGDTIGDRIERLTLKKRGLDPSWSCQKREDKKKEKVAPARPT